MTTRAFHALYAHLAATASLKPLTASARPSPPAKPTAPPVATANKSFAPVKSQATLQAERQAAERARVAAAAEAQRKAALAAEAEKVKRKAAADFVWTKAWGRADPTNPVANVGNARAVEPADRSASQQASDDVWARAQAKLDAQRGIAPDVGSNLKQASPGGTAADDIWSRAYGAEPGRNGADRSSSCVWERAAAKVAADRAHLNGRV